MSGAGALGDADEPGGAVRRIAHQPAVHDLALVVPSIVSTSLAIVVFAAGTSAAGWTGCGSCCTRVPAPDTSAVLAGQLVHVMVADRSLSPVDQVAARVGLPVCRLQRLFAEHGGVPPKGVLMRARLHDAHRCVG